MNVETIATRQGMFTILAADQLVAVGDILGVPVSQSNADPTLKKLLEELITAYKSAFSSILVSPEVSHATSAGLFSEVGSIFPLERRTFDADPLSVPILSQTWSVEAVRNNYGVAKLELFFNPEEKEAATKKQLVAEVYDYCQHEGIDLLLEVLVYMEGSEQEYQEHFPDLQLGAVQELRNLCSVMALEYPLSALGAVTLTAELDIPWLLSMRNTPYELAKEQLRTVLESGARGYMGIEQFLPDRTSTSQNSVAPAFDQEKVRQFIQTTGRDRALELARIVAEAGQTA